jgi:hypothetical protein
MNVPPSLTHSAHPLCDARGKRCIVAAFIDHRVHHHAPVLRHSFGDYGRENQEIKRQKISAKLQLVSFFYFSFFSSMKMANSHTPERICRLGGKE